MLKILGKAKQKTSSEQFEDATGIFRTAIEKAEGAIETAKQEREISDSKMELEDMEFDEAKLKHEEASKRHQDEQGKSNKVIKSCENMIAKIKEHFLADF